MSHLNKQQQLNTLRDLCWTHQVSHKEFARVCNLTLETVEDIRIGAAAMWDANCLSHMYMQVAMYVRTPRDWSARY